VPDGDEEGRAEVGGEMDEGKYDGKLVVEGAATGGKVAYGEVVGAVTEGILVDNMDGICTDGPRKGLVVGNSVG